MGRVLRLKRPFNGSFFEAMRVFTDYGKGTMLCYRTEDKRVEYVSFTPDDSAKVKVINKKLYFLYEQNFAGLGPEE